MKSRLHELDLENKTVFLRADLNVPIDQYDVKSDFKLRALQPTLDLLIKKHAKIFLATHCKVSTRYLVPWFKTNGYSVLWAESTQIAQQLVKDSSDESIILLENLRTDEREQNPSMNFAVSLKELAEFYVNDAFGVLHKKDTSVTLLPSLYDSQHKTIGLLVEKELHNLQKLIEPVSPFVLFMGGAKVKTKLPIIEALLYRADTIVVLPALVFTLLKAQNKEVGTSLVDDSQLDTARRILKKAADQNKNIVIPQDWLVQHNVFSSSLNADSYGVSVGSESQKLFNSIIRDARTIFINGAMGFSDKPETMKPFYELLHTIAHNSGFTCAGGGDTLEAIERCKLVEKFSFCSTGGGSTLYYIAYKELPALAFMH